LLVAHCWFVADLSGMFHWNTRYLYVAVLAHYEQNGKVQDYCCFGET